jgi:hypothetical protein
MLGIEPGPHMLSTYSITKHTHPSSVTHNLEIPRRGVRCITVSCGVYSKLPLIYCFDLLCPYLDEIHFKSELDSCL